MTSRSLRQLFRAALAAAPLAACGGGGAPVVEPPPPATGIVVVTQPGEAISGSPLTVQPVVQFRTAAGAVATSYTAAVTTSLVGANGALQGTTTVNAVNGTATYTDLRVTGVGTYTLSFSTPGFPATSTGTFNIAPVPATGILVVTQPAGAVSGSPLTVQPVVQFRTATGAIATSYTAPVTAALVGAGGTLQGTSTVNAVSGSATFTDLRVTGAGTYAMSFSTPGFSATSTGTFNITPLIGPPVSLAVASPRTFIFVGSTASLQPTVRDAQGIVITGAATTFMSRAPDIASVAADGIVTAKARGQSIAVATLASNAALADSSLIVAMPMSGSALYSSLTGFSLKRDTTLTISIYVDLRGSGKAVSSGVIDVVVNPAQLLYQSFAPGSLVTPEINAAVAGRVRLAFVITYGSGGLVEIARLTYTAGATAGTTGALTLVASEATASDYTDLLPGMAQVTQPLVLR